MTGEAGKRDKWDDADKPEPDSNRRYKANSDGYANAPDDDAENAQPLPLLPELPQPQPFPIEALPAVMRDAINAIASKVQVGDDLAAQSVLATAALATQACADVRMPSGVVCPLSLFFYSVAATGERKTSSDKEAQRGVEKFEKDRRELEAAEFEQWRIDHATWEGEKKKILAARKLDREQRRRELEALGPEPEKPLKPDIVFDDPTMEGIAKHWPSLRPALGIFTSEGALLVGGHSMSDDHKAKSGAFLSALWDGRVPKRLRAADENYTSVVGRRLSIHAMLQPEIAMDFLSDPQLRGQGLMSRFLGAAPSSRRGSRLFERPTREQLAGIETFGEVIFFILDRQLQLAAGTKNELKLPAIDIGFEAADVWKEFYDKVELRCGKGELYHDLAGFADKAGEHACRMAAVFALISNPSADVVDADTMRGAVKVMDWYLGEAVRLQEWALGAKAGSDNRYRKAGVEENELRNAVKLREWLEARPDRNATVREALQFGPYRLRRKKQLMAAAQVLCEHKWIEKDFNRTLQLRDGAGPH